MDRKKVVALGAAVIAFAAFAAWTALSIPDPPPVQETSQQQEMEYGKNVIREEVGGKLVWELVTSSSTVDMNTQTTVFKNAKGKYYFADGKELTLTAPEGNYNGETKNVKLWGGVTALMSDGTKLTSKELEWLAGKDRLVATGEAKFIQPGVKLEADRIEGWNEFQEFKATGHAHIEKEADKKNAEGAKKNEAIQGIP
ncbi:MAG: LPS export ABC transporter periplasmic protein LptC [Schwartzia sp.]|nr:LPS export ABC transporter periplasmic protein LptC [Schwartzia sp. (in: firmicutes)]